MSPIRLLTTGHHGVLCHLRVFKPSEEGMRRFFFNFPKESVRKKTWTNFCRREDFIPSKNSRRFSLHFTKEQLYRDPEKLRENGYDGAKIRLKSDAHPDIPLLLQQPQDENSAISLPPARLGERLQSAREQTQVFNFMHLLDHLKFKIFISILY